MTLDSTNGLIAMHLKLASGYNRCAAKMVPGKINRNSSKLAATRLIHNQNPDEQRLIKPAVEFTSAFTI